MLIFLNKSRERKIATISIITALLMIFCLVATSCKKTKDKIDITDLVEITLLIQSDIAHVEREDDPYLRYISENYGINLKIIVVDSFATQGNKYLIEDENQVDIVAFSRLADFSYYKNLDVFENIEKHLDKLPNFKNATDLETAISPEAVSTAKRFLAHNGKYHAISTLPAVPIKSMRIRTDWLKAYDFASNYQPKTADDLLSIANYYRNTDPDLNGKKDTYAFTSDNASQGDLGDIIEMISLMFGRTNSVPDGFFINDKNKVDHGILNGNHKEALDYVKMLVEKDLIEPTWFDKSDGTNSIISGKIGTAWFGNEISKLTELEHMASQSEGLAGSTIGNWNTINIPTGNENGGRIGVDTVFENLFALTKSGALDGRKLEKALPFLNDLITSYSIDEKGKTTFNRSKTYDALVYGVGIEEDLSFIASEAIESDYVCANLNEKELFRTKFSHVENYYSWFKSSYDGVYMGDERSPSEGAIKTMSNAEAQLAQPLRVDEGSLLSFDEDVLNTLNEMITHFEYNYVFPKENISKQSSEEEYQEFIENFLNLGGKILLSEAEKQFETLGVL